MGATETDAAIGALTPGALEAYGNGVPLDFLQLPYIPDDIREHGELIPVGMGRYMLRFDDPGGLAGGEGDDGLIGGIGDDELLELANLLNDVRVDQQPPVDGVTEGALHAEAAEEPEEVQVAGLGKLLLGLATTTSGRAILRALGRTVRGARRKAGEAEDPLSDLAADAARNAVGRAIADVIEGRGPSDAPQRDNEELLQTEGSSRKIAQGSQRYTFIGGREYVRFTDGGVDFGVFPEEVADSMGTSSDPIRLPKGFHDPVEDDGFGDVHIEIRHGSEIRKFREDGEARYQDPAELVADVARRYTEIWIQPRNGRYLFAMPNGNARTVVLELVKGTDHNSYDVVTAGIFSTSYVKGGGRILVWKRP